MAASIHAPHPGRVNEARPLDWNLNGAHLASLTGSALLPTGLATTLQQRPPSGPFTGPRQQWPYAEEERLATYAARR
jgi:hypothetical protein